MTSKSVEEGRDFQWFLDNDEELAEYNSNRVVIIRGRQVYKQFEFDDSESLDEIIQKSASDFSKTLPDLLIYQLEACSKSLDNYKSLIKSLNKSYNLYRTYIFAVVYNDGTISEPYIFTEVGDKMTVGTQVYHTTRRMNLIICQISSGNKVICINPSIINDGQYQILTVNIANLQKGWNSQFE